MTLIAILLSVWIGLSNLLGVLRRIAASLEREEARGKTMDQHQRETDAFIKEQQGFQLAAIQRLQDWREQRDREWREYKAAHEGRYVAPPDEIQ